MSYIPSGIAEIDELIDGWPKRAVTLLVGESGVGKSTLLILSAILASRRNVRVYYIDTEGNCIPEAGSVIVERAVESMESLENSINKLLKLPRDMLEESLIIVDSITYHYHALIRMAENDTLRDRIQADLEKIIYTLNNIAVRYDSAVVLSTWPTSMVSEEEEGGFVGGFAVRTYSRIQLRMFFTDIDDDVRGLEVVKHQDPRRYKMQRLIRLSELAKLLGGVGLEVREA